MRGDMTIAQRAIREQGRKQSWIAEQLGISRSALSLKLRGRRRFDPDELKELARILGLPADLITNEASKDEAAA